MKTTVKRFILDNMTDSNFEKVVDLLIIESVRIYDSEISVTVSEYLNKQKPCYSKNNSFEILNEIKKISDAYILNYKEDAFLDWEMEFLNRPTSQWMPTMNKPEENSDVLELKESIANSSESDSEKVKVEIIDADPFSSDEEIDISDCLPFGSEPQEKDKLLYNSFSQLKIAFLTETYQNIEKNYINPWDVNATNYQEYVHQEKNKFALGLSNFIYEILHYTTEAKLEQFSDERSLVKIDNDNEYSDEYCVHFHLDNRTRYISEEVRSAYYKRYDCEFEQEPPKFIEYEILLEYLFNYEYTYILAPFTDYLNEELIVPEVSEKYGIFEQLIQILTFQGFTKDEQITEICSANKTYENRIL
ncbi:hypothetical protein [Bacillus niameyensis]|uniref:hypothetical protein n=1 Tax=Bacillus niameyensis TaxID=1522308 RepID=UPI0007848B3E|nr:hypothetical protein [Bacillus niameyensis]